MYEKLCAKFPRIKELETVITNKGDDRTLAIEILNTVIDPLFDSLDDLNSCNGNDIVARWQEDGEEKTMKFDDIDLVEMLFNIGDAQSELRDDNFEAGWEYLKGMLDYANISYRQNTFSHDVWLYLQGGVAAAIELEMDCDSEAMFQ